MEKQYKMAVMLTFIPAFVNICVSLWFFLSFSKYDFMGSFVGTLLGIILSVIWLVQVKNSFGAHAIKLLKVTYKWFFVKFIVFLVFVSAIYFMVEFNVTWFVISLLVALSMSAVIELWFYRAISREG